MDNELQAAVDMLKIYRGDPVLFVTQVIGAVPTTQQIAGLKAIARPGAHVSIRSGHGTGKSGMLSWIILWHLCTHSESKIPCTAPTSNQLNDILWSELAKWHGKMIPEFRREIILNAERACVMGAEKVEFAVPRTARKENPEALQGFHSKNLLFVIDEASGVDDVIFEVAEGALSSPGARVIMASNPTRTDGYFFDSHHKARQFWDTMHFSCQDSPLVAPEYAEQMALKYGANSNIYRVRVLGDFPSSEEDQFITLELVESAVNRDVEGYGPCVWGVDPAYMGSDETVLAKRLGDVIYEVRGVRQFDTMQTCGWILDQYRAETGTKPQAIVVDVIGIGAGVYDRLRELGYPAVACNVAESPAARQSYVNLRSELWGRYRDWLQERRGKIPNDDDLIAQSTGIKYDFDSSGRLRLEGKKDLRKRGLPSPDRADAVCLTFYQWPDVAHDEFEEEYYESFGRHREQGRSAEGGY